ncbi:MAG TPA: hypothetical protein VGT05_00555 [Patescibacteria group bacterium]|nr:hypothetical protein [Patescibacteria group bacterium]
MTERKYTTEITIPEAKYPFAQAMHLLNAPKHQEVIRYLGVQLQPVSTVQFVSDLYSSNAQHDSTWNKVQFGSVLFPALALDRSLKEGKVYLSLSDFGTCLLDVLDFAQSFSMTSRYGIDFRTFGTKYSPFFQAELLFLSFHT